MFGTSAADSRRSARPVLPNSRGEQLPRDPLYERYDEIRVSLPTQLRRARVASGVARDGVPLSRRDETSFPRVRPIARIPRLGVAAATVSWVCRCAGLPAVPDAGRSSRWVHTRRATFDQACQLEVAAEPLSAAAIGDMLRHALGLSAWKRFGASRWALRVNPSSGNLHPTEAYVICGALPGLADRPAVYHYAADRHAIELRCVFDEGVWHDAFGGRRDSPARRADVHSLARSVEIRRAGVPLLPARPRSRDRGRVDRRRARRVARRPAAGVVAPRDRGGDRHRSRGGFHRSRTRGARLHHGDRRRGIGRLPPEDRGTARRRRRTRPVVGPRESAERGSHRVVVHRRGRTGH